MVNVLTRYEHVCLYPGPVCGTQAVLRNPHQKETRVPFSKIYRNLNFLWWESTILPMFILLMDFIWYFEKMQSAYEFFAHFRQILSNFGWFVTHFLKTKKYSHVWGPGFPHLNIKKTTIKRNPLSCSADPDCGTPTHMLLKVNCMTIDGLIKVHNWP